MEATLGCGEYADWLAFWEVEPWGAYRDNLHTGILASLLATPKKGHKRPAPSEFLLRTKDEQREQSTGKALSWLRAVAKRKQ